MEKARMSTLTRRDAFSRGETRGETRGEAEERLR
jgi:hypothetical protein